MYLPKDGSRYLEASLIYTWIYQLWLLITRAWNFPIFLFLGDEEENLEDTERAKVLAEKLRDMIKEGIR